MLPVRFDLAYCQVHVCSPFILCTSGVMAFHHMLIHSTAIQTIRLELGQGLTLHSLRHPLKQILLALIGLNLFIGFVYRGLLFKNFFKNGGFKTPINFLICKFFLFLIWKLILFSIKKNAKPVPTFKDEASLSTSSDQKVSEYF